MVGILIRMRLHLLRRTLSTGTTGVLFALGLVFGVVAALGTVALIVRVTGTGDLELGTTATAAVFGLWTLGWLFGPIVTGSSDETLQPEQFRLLPIDHRRLAAGLLAAGFAGAAPVVNLIAFGGLAVRGVLLGPVPALVGVLGALLQLAFVVLLSRVVLGWIGAAMRSRKGKDLAVLFAALAGLAYYPANLLIQHLGPMLMHQVPPTLATVLLVAPSGWAPYAVDAAARGDWLFAVLPLAGLAVLIFGMWRMWAFLLRRRRMTSPPGVASSGPRSDRMGGLLGRIVPPTPLGAVLVKELRMWWRDSRRRAALLPMVLVGLAMPIFPALQGNFTFMVPFAGLSLVWTCTLGSANLYGMDGTALWHTLVTPDAARADVRGRQLAWLVFVAPPALLAGLILPGVTGHPGLCPWVLAFLSTLLGAGAGLVVLLSVLAPFPVPQRQGNPFASNNNAGCAKGLMQLGLSVAQLVLLLPPLALLLIGEFAGLPVLRWLAIPVGIALGAVTAWRCGVFAQRRITRWGPELMAVVRPR
ncbi:hypothetical protein D5S17_08680 [Pseudonocardiaceae bacterium YIM PH 21723]|nr:hypothetical protein D5S17_08680 [Pseudonocardiaceae bacterium YIM PH 21723]